ncbi:MAG TPA: Spy/CpxP family protein refolding chaperone, partial [Ramlibacter sp.]|nr:Spy/CpxP family protein refolding chaperone [Ramlibacter sp.]
LALASNAQTPPAPPAAGSAPGMAREQHGRFDPARMQERVARRLAELKQKLQITPAQEGAWTAYTAALKPDANFVRPQPGELEKLTTPERIDRMRALQAERAARMDKRFDATKTFYAALSADQKKIFDAATLRRGHGRHHGAGGHPAA